MAESLQFLAQFDEVVDLAVEDDDVTSIAAQHRLVAGRRQIQDRKAAKPQGDVILREHAVIVRTAMCEQVGHAC